MEGKKGGRVEVERVLEAADRKCTVREALSLELALSPHLELQDHRELR